MDTTNTNNDNCDLSDLNELTLEDISFEEDDPYNTEFPCLNGLDDIDNSRSIEDPRLSPIRSARNGKFVKIISPARSAQEAQDNRVRATESIKKIAIQNKRLMHLDKPTTYNQVLGQMVRESMHLSRRIVAEKTAKAYYSKMVLNTHIKELNRQLLLDDTLPDFSTSILRNFDGSNFKVRERDFLIVPQMNFALSDFERERSMRHVRFDNARQEYEISRNLDQIEAESVFPDVETEMPGGYPGIFTKTVNSIKAVLEMPENVNKAMNSIPKAIDNFSDVIDRNGFSAVLGTATSTFNALKENVNAATKFAKKNDFYITILILFITTFNLTVIVPIRVRELKTKKEKNEVIKFAMILNVLALINYGRYYVQQSQKIFSQGKEIHEMLLRITQENEINIDSDIQMEEIVPQAGSPDTVLDTLSTALVMIMSGGNENIVSQARIKSVCKDLGSCKKGMNDLLKVIVRVSEGAINWFRESVMDLPSLKLLSHFGPEVDNFNIASRNLSHKWNNKSITMNDSTFNQVCSLEMVGLKLIANIKRTPDTTGMISEIQNNVNRLYNIKVEFEKSNYSMNGCRQETVGVKFYGGPGTGKSVAMEMMAREITAAILDPSQLEDFKANQNAFVFNRASETEYWDGYTPKAKVVMIDDFGQAKDVAGNPDNEYMSVIRAVNSFEYPLHMAALAEKGKVTFQSPVFMVTTNLKEFSPKSLISVEALNRRFIHKFMVVPKPEYTKDETLSCPLDIRKIDKSKLPPREIKGDTGPLYKGVQLSSMSSVIWNFYIIDEIGQPIGDPISYDEVRDRIIESYHVNQQRFILNREIHSEILDKFIKLRNTPDNSGIAKVNDLFELDEETESSSTWTTTDKFVELCPNFEIYCDILRLYYPQYRRYTPSQIKLLMLEFGFDEAVQYCKNKDYTWIHRQVPVSHIKTKFCSVKDYFLTFLHKIPGYDTLNSILEFYKSEIFMGAAFLFSAGIVGMVSKFIYELFFPPCENEPNSIGHSDKMKAQTVKKQYVRNSNAVKTQLITPQMGSDSSGVALMKSIIKSNTYSMEVCYEGEYNLVGHITFVKGTVAIMPYHFILKMCSKIQEEQSVEDCMVRFYQGEGVTRIDHLFTIREILLGHETGCLQDVDMVLVKLPGGRIQPRRDITKYFALRSDYDKNAKNIEIMIPIPGSDKITFCGTAQALDAPINVGSIATGVYQIRKGYSYAAPTSNGDCGALMIVMNNRLATRKIFGIHAAGHVQLNMGYASAVCQEDIFQDLELFEEGEIEVLEPEVDILPEAGEVFMESRFNVLGHIKKYPRRNMITSIIRSSLYGTYKEAYSKPAHLRKFKSEGGIYIDPLCLVQKKFCTPDVYINPESLLRVSDTYWEWYESACPKYVKRRILSVKEAIFGLKEEDGLRAIPSSTSPGYPMSVSGNRNIKKEIMEFVDDQENPKCLALLDEIESDIEDLLELYKDSKRPWWLYSDNLKDERLPSEKVDAGKVRLFCGSPFYLLILTRMYFGSFSQHFLLNRVHNGCAGGVNPYSSEWDVIARKLSVYDVRNTMVGAGDYSGFDGSEKPQIHSLICSGISRWYNGSEEDDLIRKILFLDISNSRHVIDGVVYQWESSLPSGSAMTLVVNSIYNHYAFRWCYLRLIGDPYDFDTKVYLIVLGDDNVFTVHPSIRLKFNEMTIVKPMGEIGLTYTTELKGEAVLPFRSLNEVEFLKRSFIFNKTEFRHVAPLRLDVILEMPFWTRKGSQRDNITAENVVNSIRELSLHGKDVFDKWSPLIRENFKRLYPNTETSMPLNIPYQTLLSKVLETEEYY